MRTGSCYRGELDGDVSPGSIARRDFLFARWIKSEGVFNFMRKVRVALIAALFVSAIPIVGELSEVKSAAAAGNDGPTLGDDAQILSPIWNAPIRQWSMEIDKEARANGLDPDFIAAVMHVESNGDQIVVSRAGAVGLMGVMPSGPGLEWRPQPETLLDPEINLNWGVAILSEIIRQSGGDIAAALAAYSGGWDQVESTVPQKYASRVLNEYGKAVAARENVSPDIASQWTIALDIRRGHIPVETPILSQEPVSGLRMYGEHIIYNYADENGRAYNVKGYAVPLVVVKPIAAESPPSSSDTVDSQLMARLGMAETKVNKSNPRVIMACLPSLTRLRGRIATRWFAPTGCPSWHR